MSRCRCICINTLYGQYVLASHPVMLRHPPLLHQQTSSSEPWRACSGASSDSKPRYLVCIYGVQLLCTHTRSWWLMSVVGRCSACCTRMHPICTAITHDPGSPRPRPVIPYTYINPSVCIAFCKVRTSISCLFSHVLPLRSSHRFSESLVTATDWNTFGHVLDSVGLDMNRQRSNSKCWDCVRSIRSIDCRVRGML